MAFYKLIFQSPPANFSPTFESVAIFMECDKKVLFLRRKPHKIEGGTWCLPGGKIEDKESPEEALLREIKEETSLVLKKEQLTFWKKFFMRTKTIDFVFHLFHAFIEGTHGLVEVVLKEEEEHDAYLWKTPKEAIELPLISGGEKCLRFAYGDDLNSFKSTLKR